MCTGLCWGACGGHAAPRSTAEIGAVSCALLLGITCINPGCFAVQGKQASWAFSKLLCAACTPGLPSSCQLHVFSSELEVLQTVFSKLRGACQPSPMLILQLNVLSPGPSRPGLPGVIISRDAVFLIAHHTDAALLLQFDGHLISPKEFVHLAGKSTLKDWKRAIRMNGIMLRSVCMAADGISSCWGGTELLHGCCVAGGADVLLNAGPKCCPPEGFAYPCGQGITWGSKTP